MKHPTKFGEVGEVGRADSYEEIEALLPTQAWDLVTLREVAWRNAFKGQPFSPAIFDELSQEDLDWLTAHFQVVKPVFWLEVLQRINRLFSGKVKSAGNPLPQTRALLPDSVSPAPVFLMVAEAYTVTRTKEERLAMGIEHPLEHADNFIRAIVQFESDLDLFQRRNERKPDRQGPGPVHMSGARVRLEDGKLAGTLTELRNDLTDEMARIDKALTEIRATQEEGIVPGDRHEDAFGDRVYHALEGCQKLIALRWNRERGPQKKALEIFALWDVKITAGQFRAWKLRQRRKTEGGNIAN